MLARNRPGPKYKSIKVRLGDFKRFKDLAHKKGQKLMDLFSSIIG